MSPPEALQATSIERVSPAEVIPEAMNCTVSSGSSSRFCGLMMSWVNSGGESTTSMQAVTSRSGSAMTWRASANRRDSLCLNGMLASPDRCWHNKRAASFDWVSICWRPGGRRDYCALVPWLCVTAFRRLCSGQQRVL